MGRWLFVVLVTATVVAWAYAEETKKSPATKPSGGKEAAAPPYNPPPSKSSRKEPRISLIGAISAEPSEAAGDTPIQVRVPVRIPVTTTEESTLQEGTEESRPPVRPSTRFRTEFRELPFPRPSAEEEAELRQELKEALQRKVDSLSVESLMEDVYREREASREEQAWKKFQRLREELGALEKEFPGTAAADGAARMQGAVPATPEPATTAPPKQEAPVPEQQEGRKVEALPRGKETIVGPATHPLTLKVGSGARHVAISPRGLGQDLVIRGGIKPDAGRFERVITMTRGVSIVIEEASSNAKGSNGIQIAAERAVLWTDAGRADEIRGIEIDDNTHFQLYLEGDVVIRQGGHVVEASSAYYDFHEQHGRFTKEEIGTNLRESEAALRIRGTTLREKAQNKHTRASAVEQAFETGEGAKVLDEKGPAPRENLDDSPFRARPGNPFSNPIRLEEEKADQETAPGAAL